ncbi:ATP-binding protein [Thermococci archaeon]|nr:MAG: ATP-binding protein [Thermococci archaeon]
MLFNPRPKTTREELYDREYELESIKKFIEKKIGLIAIFGIRRLGKSSLVNVALNEIKYPSVKIDAAKIYSEFGEVPKEEVVRAILRELVKYSPLEKVREILGSIKGIKVLGVEFEVTHEVSLSEILERLNSMGRFVIAIDEAQYLRFSRTRYDMLISWAIDELENVTFILTGSEVGLLEDFLRLHDPESPLFGRPYAEIRLSRFSYSESYDFLRRGFEELNLEVPEEEIREAVEELDGIVGWLTLYGYNRYLGYSHLKALEKLKEDAKRLINLEFSKLKKLSKKYELIMKIVARGTHRWSEIKEKLELMSGKINDKRFSDLLKNLVRYGYLEKRDGGYFIPDPLVEVAFRR